MKRLRSFLIQWHIHRVEKLASKFTAKELEEIHNIEPIDDEGLKYGSYACENHLTAEVVDGIDQASAELEDQN